MYKKLILSIFFLIILIITVNGKNQNGKMGLSKVTVLEYQQFDANQIRCWVGNNGEIVSYNVTGNSGLEWPKFSGLYSIFQSGLWIIGVVNGEIRSAAAEYTSEYSPGSIIYDPQTLSRGVPNDPELSRYRIYKVQAGDDSDPSSPAYNADYADWPVADGAPAHDGEYFTDLNGNNVWDANEEFSDYDLDGQYDAPNGTLIEGEDPPIISGNQMLWFVYSVWTKRINFLNNIRIG